MRHESWQRVHGMHIILKANASIDLETYIRWMSNAFVCLSLNDIECHRYFVATLLGLYLMMLP
jgi:hypothetical protein